MPGRLGAERGELGFEPNQLGAQTVLESGRGELGEANAEARDLHLVGRTDAAARRADLVLARGALARLVQRHVHRQQGLGSIRNEQAPFRLDSGGVELLDLLEERLGRDHHAVAHDAELIRMENPRRNQAEREVTVAELDRVPGIVPTLVAHHGVESGTEQVDDLPLPLVPPLHAHHHDVRHPGPPREKPPDASTRVVLGFSSYPASSMPSPTRMAPMPSAAAGETTTVIRSPVCSTVSPVTT